MKLAWPFPEETWLTAGTSVAGMTLKTLALNDADNSIALTTMVRTAGTIQDIGFWLSAKAGVPPSYKATIEGVDASGNPDGVEAASVTFDPTTMSAGSWNWVTTGGVAKNVGDIITVRIKPGGVAPDVTNNITVGSGIQLTNRAGWPTPLEFTTLWTKVQRAPSLAYRLATGVVGYPGAASGIVSSLLNSGSNPNAWGVRFTTPRAMKSIGAIFHLSGLATANYKYQLRKVSDNSVIADTGSLSLSVAPLQGAGGVARRWHYWPAGEVSLAAATDYRLVFLPLNTNNVRHFRVTCPDAATQQAIMSEGSFTWVYTSSADGGNTWVDTPTDWFNAELILSGFPSAPSDVQVAASRALGPMPSRNKYLDRGRKRGTVDSRTGQRMTPPYPLKPFKHWFT